MTAILIEGFDAMVFIFLVFLVCVGCLLMSLGDFFHWLGNRSRHSQEKNIVLTGGKRPKNPPSPPSGSRGIPGRPTVRKGCAIGNGEVPAQPPPSIPRADVATTKPFDEWIP